MNAELQKAYDFSIKGIIAKITLAMAILSSIRFLVDVYQLNAARVLANILKTYQVVFHTCVDVLLIWLPYTLPAWGKDVLILYLMLAFVVMRVRYRQAEINSRHPWLVRHNFRNSARRYWLSQVPGLVNAALLWPFHAWRLVRKPFLVIPSGSHGPGALYLDRTRPQKEGWHGYLGDARLIMLVRLGAIICGAAVVMLFNYAFSI